MQMLQLPLFSHLRSTTLQTSESTHRNIMIQQQLPELKSEDLNLSISIILLSTPSYSSIH